MTMRSPSKMPVRGGSRSRYSITIPYLTTPDVTSRHSATMSFEGSSPTRRLLASSRPCTVSICESLQQRLRAFAELQRESPWIAQHEQTRAVLAIDLVDEQG